MFLGRHQAKHIEICKKQKEKKRKVFDSYKQRQILDGNEAAENKNEGKPVDQPASKPRTRIVKPVSRPAAKPSNRPKVAEDKKVDDKKSESETNVWPKNKTKNGTTTNETNPSGATKTAKPNPTQNGSLNGKMTGQSNGNHQTEDHPNSNQGSVPDNRKATNGKKSQWRENHEEFVRSIQAAKGSLESSDESVGTHKPNGHEPGDKESTITTNSESTSNTTASSTATINLAAATTNERMHPDGEERGERPKPAPRQIQPPQSRLNKGKLAANPANAQQLTNGNAKQVNGQAVMNGASTGSGSAHSSSSNGQTSTPATTKKSMNSVECPTCGRSFNRAAGERHITFCAEQQRQRKSSSNVTNEEALARWVEGLADFVCHFFGSQFKVFKIRSAPKQIPGSQRLPLHESCH